MTRDTHTYCRAVTTCFYDLGPLRLGFEHPIFRLRDQRSSPLRHRRSYTNGTHVKLVFYFFRMAFSVFVIH